MNSPVVNPTFVVQISLVRGGVISQFSFSQFVLGMGRDEDNDVILDDPRISRHHLRVEQAGGNLSVTDLGSTNGTLISGLLLSPRVPRRLTMGEEVEAGGFSFSIRPAQIGDPMPSPAKVHLSPFVASSLEISYQGQVQKIALSRPIFTLGRASDNDIVINHEVISRRHARIEQKGDSFVIYDLNSTNGLIVNRQRVSEFRLEDNQPVVIGRNEVLITFHRRVGPAPAGQPEQRSSITGWILQAPVVPSSAGLAGAQPALMSRQAPAAYPEPPPAAAQPQDRTGYLNLKGRDIITVGRAPDNRVVLNNPQVSAHHVIFERMCTRYRIKDLKSETGVYVNGKRIDKEAWLKQGAEIRIGGVRMILREEGIQHFSAEGLRLDVFHLQKWVSKNKNLLQDISLCIHPQEFVALAGMSGSGKSTLMDAINSFRPATQGNVVVNGVDLYSNFELFRGDLGYVPQKDIVHQELTVYSALSYAAQLRMPADTTGASATNGSWKCCTIWT